MWNLFKETFRSFSKNKIVLIGLSILIFLSSGVFSLLYEVKESYQNQLNDYNKVSKLHDVTVDLDLNDHGQLFNNGFNLKTKLINDKKRRNLNEFIIDKDAKLKPKKSLVFNDEFLSLKKDFSTSKFFKGTDTTNTSSLTIGKELDLYIPSNYFKKIYNSFLINSDKSLANFDLDNKNFRFKRNEFLYAYKKEGDNFVFHTTKTNIDHNTSFVFDDDYKVSDLISIIGGTINTTGHQESDSLISTFGSIYLNVATKEASLMPIKRDQWRNDGSLLQIMGSDVAKMLGAQPISDQEEINVEENILISQENAINATLKAPNAFSTQSGKVIIDINKIFTRTFKLPTDFKKREFSKLKIQIAFSLIETHKLLDKWINQIILRTYLQQFVYETTFTEKTKNKFNNEYINFYENKDNFINGKLDERYSLLTYWKKIQRFSFKNSRGQEKINEIVLPIILSDLSTRLIELPIDNQFYKETNFKNDHFFTKSQIAIKTSIVEQENKLKTLNISNTPTLTQFNDITNENIRNDRANEIKDIVIKNYRFILYKEIEKLVGKNNYGIRQTLSSNVFDTNINKDQVFHFINTGSSSKDKNNSFYVDGVKQNVGKLYNESFLPTVLNSYSTKLNPNYSLDNIPPFYTEKIIQALINGFSMDKDYMIVKISFDNFSLIQDNVKTDFINSKIIQVSNQTNKIEYGFVYNGNEINRKKMVSLIEKSNGIWIQSNIEDSQNLNNKELILFLTKNNFILNYTLGINKSWFASDKDQSNRFSIPCNFLNLQATIFNEAVKTQTLNNFFKILKNSLFKSQLFLKKWWSKTTIQNIIFGLKKSLTKHKFVRLVLQGKMDSSKLSEILLETLYIISNEKGDQSLKNIFIEPLNKIKTKINEKKTLQEKRDYLEMEISNLSKILKKGLGLDLLALIKNIMPLKTFLKYIKNPENVLSEIMNLINSIDTTQFLGHLNKWYKDFNGEIDNKNRRYYFSQSELIIPLVKSWDQPRFKLALQGIINEIDFAEVFKTDLDDKDSLFYKITKDIKSEKLKNSFKDIFNDIGVDAQYSNINRSLNEIISLIHQDKLVENIEASFKEVEFNININKKEILFVSKELTNLDVIVSFIKSASENDVRLKQIFSNLLNLSRKVEKIEFRNHEFFSPGREEGKLDLFDLQFLEVLSYEELAEYKDTKIYETKIVNKDFTFTNKQKKFLKDILGLNDEDLSKGNLIKNNIAFFKNVLSNFELKFELNDDGSYKLIDGRSNYANLIEKVVEKTIKNDFLSSQTFKKLEILKAEGPSLASTVNSLIIYNYWIDFASKLLEANPTLSLIEVNAKLNKIFMLSQDNEIESILNDKVLNNKQENNSISKLFDKVITDPKSSKGLLQPSLTSKEIFTQTEERYKIATINDFVQKNPDIFDIISKNQALLTSELAKISFNGHYKNAIKSFLESFLIDKVKLKNELKILNNLSNSFARQSKEFLSLNISPSISSSYLSTIFVRDALWFSTKPGNPKPNINPPNYNLEYLVKQKLQNFSTQTLEEIKKSFRTFIIEEKIPYKFKSFENSNSNINIDYLNFIKNIVLKNENSTNITIFGLDMNSLIFGENSDNGILNGFFEEDLLKDKIVFSDVASYFVKVNQAWLIQNKKEIYDDSISTNPDEIELLLDTLDEKFILDANGSKFIIIGVETTADYLYPVISEENLQVDTKNQALAYVNQSGFDRMHSSSPSSVVKTYILVKNNEKQSNQDLVKTINRFVTNNGLSINQKAFEATKMDPINPERSLRINVVDKVIKVINLANLYIVIIFLILVGISTIFISNRYVSNRKKVIGILIAQGYQPIKIAISFTLFALFTSLIGGFLGYITGHFSQIFLMNAFSSYWTLPIIPLEFNIISMLVSFILPFIGMSSVIIVTTLVILRIKPIDLITSAHELKIGKIAQISTNIFKNFNIKTRFVGSLLINTIWKLSALLITLTLVSFVTLFSISTNNTFNNAVNKTYQNRKYEYKIDLLSPTIEGGLYTTFDKHNLKNALYSPVGNSNDASVYAHDYFRPGISSVANFDGNLIYNGNPNEFPNHIFTKSSIDIDIDIGLSVNPWEITYNSLPDSQRSKVISQTLKIVYLLEKTQNLKIDDKGNEYAGTINNPIPYFKFLESKNSGSDFGSFFYMIPTFDKDDNATIIYVTQEIKTSFIEHELRDKYRAFLISGYEKIQENDFFISYGSLIFNPKTDELYSHAKIKNIKDNSFSNIYGYQKDSQKIKLSSQSDKDLLNTLYDSEIQNEYYPIVINHTVANKFKIWKNDIVSLNVYDHVNRYKNKFLGEASPTKQVNFYVVDINDTFINEEYIVRQDHLNILIGLDKLAKKYSVINEHYIPFNGIFSNSKNTSQIIDTISIYSKSGYWPAAFSIKTKHLPNEKIINIANELFGHNGSFIKNDFTKTEILKFINKDSNIVSNYSKLIVFINEDKNIATTKTLVDRFFKIYGNTIYTPLLKIVSSKNVESGFTKSISGTVTNLSNVSNVIAILIAIIILIIVALMIITENTRNISIFGILGYTNREKIWMFLGIYLPVLILSIFLSILITMASLKFLNSILLSSSSLVLPLAISPLNIFLSAFAIVLLFSFIITIIWFILGRVKPIYALNEED